MTDAEKTLPVGPVKVGIWTGTRCVGVGAMGEVWEARSPSGVRVAMKCIRADLVGVERIQRHFVREARAAARISHPNVVQMHDFVTDGAQCALIMEFVDGEPLSVWREAPPAGVELLEIFDQILGALSIAHARGIVHRDLKPENVLLTRHDGRLVARVMDLGVAHFRDEQATDRWSEDTLVGTPAYMGPEQALQAADVSPATDLYAVGVMLFELLTGRRPFEAKSAMGTMMAHLRQPVPPLVLRAPYVAQTGLPELVQRLLAKTPEDRFRFASDVQRALAGCTLQREGDPPARPRVARIRAMPAPEPALRRAERLGTACTGLVGVQEPPFCGRAAELSSLMDVARRVVREARTHVVLVEGSMGLGRSRLVARLREQLETEGSMQTWTGVSRWGADDEAGIRAALADGLRCAGMTRAETEQRVAAWLARHDELPADELAAVLQFLDGGRAEDTPANRVRGEEARTALLDRMTARAARAFPLCVALEDVHTSGGAPLRLARRLLNARTHRPRLLVLTLSPEALDDRPGAREAYDQLCEIDSGRVHRISLQRMRENEMRRLVKAMLPLPDETADAMALRAEGNPLIAVELLRHLADSGRLDGFGPAPSPEELLTEWPAGIQALMLERIDLAARRHGPDDLVAWERLAWLGPRFPRALARELFAFDDDTPTAPLDRALDSAILAGLLVEEPHDGLRFQHQLVRDALHQRTRHPDARRKRALHAAQARERLPETHGYADQLTIARDYATAEAWARAASAYARAASAAHASQHFADACDAWTELADLLARPDVPHDVAEPAARIRAHLGFANAAVLLGRFDDTRSAIAAVDALATQHGRTPPAEATRLLAEVEAKSGNTRASRDLHEKALAAFDTRGDVRGGAHARFGLGLLELSDGRVARAEACMREALAAFESLGDDSSVAHCFSTLGRTAHAAGLHDEAAALIEKARYRHERADNRLGLAHALLNLAEVSLARGDAADAQHRAQHAAQLFAEMGAEHGFAHTTLVRGRIAAASGQHAEARAAYEDAALAFAQLGDEQSLAITSLCRALLDTDLHDWPAAQEAVEDGLRRDTAERIDDPLFVELLLQLSRTAIFGGLDALAIRLLETVAFKLQRLGEQSPLADRLDEVQYLLAELRDDGTLLPTGPVSTVRTGPGERLDDL